MINAKTMRRLSEMAQTQKKGYCFVENLKDVTFCLSKGLPFVEYNKAYLEKYIGRNYASLFTQCGYKLLIEGDSVKIYLGEE